MFNNKIQFKWTSKYLTLFIILHLSLQMHFPPFFALFCTSASLISKDYMWNRRLHLVYQSHHRTPNTSISRCQSCQGKHNTVKYWIEQCSTHIEKKQTKVSSKCVHESLIASGCPGSGQKETSLGACSNAAAERPHHPPLHPTPSWILKYWKLEACLRTLCLKQNKDHFKSLKQGLIVPGRW